MRRVQYIGIIIVILFVGIIIGHERAKWTATCPVVCDEVCDIAQVTTAQKEAYVSLKAEETVLCEPIYVPKYIATYSECDCTIDYREGWKSCVDSYESATSIKKEKEYCDVHYCQEKILRNTRPSTR